MLVFAEAEPFNTVEGNTGRTVMRGGAALPGSKTISRRKGTRWNLGDLTRPAVATAIPGRDRKSRRRSCRGTGEESDGRIVPGKHRTKPSASVAEIVEGRWSVEGKGSRDAGCGRCAALSLTPKRQPCGSKLDGLMWSRMSVALDLRQEPGAGKPHAGICAGGTG
jgi:hypothetical protein